MTDLDPTMGNQLAANIPPSRSTVCSQNAQDDGVVSLSDEQKRHLRAVRRGYRADSVVVKNDGWDLEIRFLDGSSVTVSAKAIKLKCAELCSR